MAPPGNEFVARLLDRSASAYANLTAQRLLASHGDIASRYGPQALAHWRSNLTQRVTELATAVEFRTPALFSEAVRWAGESFAARDISVRDLRESLLALREVLAAELPAENIVEVEACLAPAIKALDSPLPEPHALDPQKPLQRLALDYIAACLEGDSPRAVRMIMDRVREGIATQDACLEVLAPALDEVGRLWHTGRLGIHEEHAVTATTHRVLALLGESAPRAARNGKTVVAASVQGNAHDTAIRIIATFFEMEGWKVVCLGTELPPDAIAHSVRDLNADLLVMSATLIPHLLPLRRSIEAVRSLSPQTKIIVGGQAFSAAPDLAGVLGADAPTLRARDVAAVGAKLVGLN
jgi:methanogenic corrinoid protein MtbC1